METKKKNYSDSFKGYYVWILTDLKENVLYAGMTTNYYRIIANHLSGNVKSTKKFIKKGNYIIKYLDLGQYIEDKQELKYIKNILLDLYDPQLNSRRNVIKGMDPSRMLELINIVHSLNNDWITYRERITITIKDRYVHNISWIIEKSSFKI